MRLRTKLGIVLLLIIAGVFLSRPVIDYFVNKNRLPGNNPVDELSSERIRLMSPDAIIKKLNLRPGDTVLDLGAGYGLNTFRLSRAVGPTGKVFATDVDPQALAFLKERAAKEGVTNVIPVQVSGHGVDSFYRDHKFDLILVSDVITEIRSPEKFFEGLRPSLREGSGRLWVINMRSEPDFTMIEFGDADKLRTMLQSGGVRSAIVRRLSPAARQELTAPPATYSPEKFSSLVIADFNRMLEDPTLSPEAEAQKWTLRQNDALLRDVLTRILKEKGAFKGEASETGDKRLLMRLLNRLIIADLMGSEMWIKATALNKLNQQQLKPLLAPLTFQSFWGEPPLKQVGYELVKEHQDLTYCSIWEFKRKY